MPIKEGDKVKVEYEGKFDDGTVFDSSAKHGKPLEFQVGAKQVIPGFEKAVMGMEKDEEKEIRMESSEAYGDYNPKLIKKIPKDKLPQDKEIKPGMMISIGLPTGQQIPAKITEVDDTTVTIDINHPLAGKNLNFKIKVVEITS